MNDHLLRCRSALRAHVRPSTLRAQGLLPPGIWRIPEQAPRGFAPRLQWWSLFRTGQMQGGASTGAERSRRLREHRTRSDNAADGPSWTGS